MDLAGAASAGAPSVAFGATANTDPLVKLAAVGETASTASGATEEAEPAAKRQRIAARVTFVDAEAETPDALRSEADTAAEVAANPAAPVPGVDSVANEADSCHSDALLAVDP